MMMDGEDIVDINKNKNDTALDNNNSSGGMMMVER